jgi:hypothetical protein
MLDSYKNQVTGKLNQPHPHFIENGIHSITLKSFGTPDVKTSELQRLQSTMTFMEKLVRMNDQLDE